MASYVALLRGVNVGGKNLIKMAELRAAFEAAGFEDVATYIQSGNVLFRAARSSTAGLERRIEGMLSREFGYQASVVLRSSTQMRAVVDGAPEGFGAEPGTYLYDVVFLKAPLTAAAALKAVPTHPEVDQLSSGRGALYFSRLASRAVQSRLNRVASLPAYKYMTIRNWNTTTKLLRLMEETLS